MRDFQNDVYLQPRMKDLRLHDFENFLSELKVLNRYHNEYHNQMITPGIGTFRWYSNALAKAFEMSGVDKPRNWNKRVSVLLNGIKITNQKAKENGTFKGKHTGGKDKLPFFLYRKIAFDMARGALSQNNCDSNSLAQPKTKATDEQGIVAALFLIHVWNYMCRQENVESIKFEDTSVEHDFKTFTFFKCKTDQSGSKRSTTQIRHAYANPLMPEICPFLIEAIYLSLGLQPSDFKNMFPHDAKSSLNNLFVTWYKALEEWRQHHCSDSDSRVDGHGIRKGVTSSMAGLVGGPPIISICNRAMWSIGKILQTYLGMEGGADRFCGRCATGLVPDSPRFAVLPPHFKDRNDAYVTAAIKLCFPHVYNSPVDTIRKRLPLLLAQLVFHFEFIDTHFHDNHMIRTTMIFQDAELRDNLYNRLYLDTRDTTSDMLKPRFDSFRVHPLDADTSENVASSTATAFANDDGVSSNIADNDGNNFPVPAANTYGNECTCKLIQKCLSVIVSVVVKQ